MNDDYVNDQCPGRCDDEHDPPGADQASFRCPTTNDWHARCELGCGEAGWTNGERWEPYPVLVGGEWVCDLGEHDLTTCDVCDEVVHYDDALYSERYGGYYCQDCYDRAGGHGRGQVAPPPPPRSVACCSTPRTSLDLLTEEYLCKCEALARQANKQPVMVAA